MKNMILLVVLICSFFSLKSFSLELKTGDILLQPLHCWSCTLIEQQENTEYSHIGMVLILNGQTYVVEAFGKVKLVSLSEFLKKTQKGKKVRVRRLDFHFYIEQNFSNAVIANSLNLINLPYDRYFLWDNKIKGNEALYCSELVYKVLEQHIPFYDLKTKVMTFDINPEYWDRYFNGKTPRGKMGISPEDFNKTSDFYTIGEL